ncbi:HipA domain-containing protein [Aquincola sp. S2]|uniref:HipA domain-containing protein n=1 Tax=Pseudaquabacterium terrae TaxID=2732868 RepID=A0ABX2EEC3_9BURK|nr:HipA domain-containing protein [Aquabacterium terrae]NRF66961.1 HipA domain-containing protein [Aquabacterium terrae]
MADELFLFNDGKRVGTLEDGPRGWRLSYAADWLNDPEAFPLSPHLALRASPYDDAAEDGLVEKYFDNLLPEGDARRRLEHRLDASAGDTFDLLRRFGRETAGAITVSADPHALPQDERYRPLPAAELLTRIRRMRVEGGSLLEASRMSLAGAQDKLAVRTTPAADITPIAELLEPVDQAPTTHILKPEPPRERRLKHVAVNEFFCMSLAHALVGAPKPFLLHSADGHEPGGEREWAYAVTRFDRREAAGHVRRLHQIDFLQLRNEWATTAAKYEKSGGAKMALMFSLAARYATAPAAALSALLNLRVMNFLMCNADAHWKNHSLLWNRGRWDVSPPYDMMCTTAYGWLDAAPALMIGGCEDETRITPEHFTAFHETCLAPHRVRIQALRLALRNLGKAIARDAPAQFERLAPRVGDANAAFLRDEVLPRVLARAAQAAEMAGRI